MNATVKIHERRGPSTVHLVVVLDNGQQVDLEVPTNDATVTGVRAAIVARLAREAAAESAKTTVPPGTVIDLAVPLDEPRPPTAKDQFRADYDRVLRWTRAVSVGVLAADDPDLVALRDTVIAQLSTMKDLL